MKKDKIHIIFKEGCIDKLFVNNQNIIKTWGFETADMSSFFSVSGGGYRNKILKKTTNISDTRHAADLIVQMHGGTWKLNIDEEIKGNKIIREHQLTTLEDSWVMDFVSRFQFKKEFFDKAVIDDREYIHKNTNIYYQYHVNEARLIGKDFNVIVRTKEAISTDKFKLYTYVRDFNDVWVVHARLMPKEWDREIIKICRSWYNKAIPQCISEILLSSGTIRDFLWYRGEKKQANFPLNAYALVKLKKGEKLQLITETKIVFK